MLLRDFIEDRVCDKCLVKPCSAASDSSIRDEVERLQEEIEDLKNKTYTTVTESYSFSLTPSAYRTIRYQPGGDSDLPSVTGTFCTQMTGMCPYSGTIDKIEVGVSSRGGYTTNIPYFPYPVEQGFQVVVFRKGDEASNALMPSQLLSAKVTMTIEKTVRS